MARFSWIKLRVLESGHKLKDLAEEAGFSYDYFIQVLNGFKKPPKDFVEKVNAVCETWEKPQRA